MNKVYVVIWRHHFQDFGIRGIFKTYEEAEHFRSEHIYMVTNPDGTLDPAIEEWEVQGE